jgi:hypothetical protein
MKIRMVHRSMGNGLMVAEESVYKERLFGVGVTGVLSCQVLRPLPIVLYFYTTAVDPMLNSATRTQSVTDRDRVYSVDKDKS